MQTILNQTGLLAGDGQTGPMSQEKAGRAAGVELLEGTDQAGLFVEIWDGAEYAEFLKFKEERLQADEHSIWKPLERYIAGGLSQQHIWHFGKPELQKQ